MAERPRLGEDLFHLLNDPARCRRILYLHRLTELSEQFLLDTRQLLRSLHNHLHEQITPSVLVQERNPLVPHAELLPALRALGNLQLRVSFESRNHDLRAQRCLRKRNRNLAAQVVPLAFEELVRFHSQHDVQIARRAAGASRVTLALVANPRSIFHARRNAYLDRVLALHASIAAACLARVRNHRSRSATNVTRPRNREESLLITNLPSPLALLACRRTPSARRTYPAAIDAYLHAANRYFRLLTKDCLFEFNRLVKPQIAALLRARLSPAAATHVEAEQVAKNIAQVLEVNKRVAALRGAGYASVPKTVVCRALVGITQHLIRFAALFELLFRVVIARIAVRVILHRQLAIRGLQLLV